MKFKVDENLPVDAVQLLCHAGYDAATVSEQHLSGRADSTVASVCRREGRILVTLDLDFADIRTLPKPALHREIVQSASYPACSHHEFRIPRDCRATFSP